MLKERPVILCIGCEKVSGDMLGPLVGSILSDDFSIDAYVYGTLVKPVNGVNIGKYINLISNLHDESIIISVDAAVGGKDEIGKIKLKDDGVIAGAALGRKDKVKGIGIVGVVAENKGDIMNNLLSSDYKLVEKLGRKIASMIYKSVNQVVKQ